ncbi:MAG: hydroxymethylbilane synthase [Deltaproteobacteria bacterium]|nr:hydroxymethylbilane synthase [Deltaproteobacteria bacterium]
MLLRIGTRGSKLAITQSEWIKGRIEAGHPDIEVDLVRIKTKGDKILDSPLSKIGGKGIFVKEIEAALLKKEVDLAVHSIKDVPAQLPEGLCLPIFPEREDPSDAFISMDYKTFDDLPRGSSVGTGSLRRSAQLLHMRPDINVVSLRGNVDTRLKRLESGDLQGIILAVAGLKRLGLSDRISQILSNDDFLPAIGQGALGLELRQDDDMVHNMLRFLNHDATEVSVKAERAFLKELAGGCQVPVAAHGRLDGDRLILRGMVAELDGSREIRDEINGQRENPEEIGVTLAKRLLASGADEILARFYGKP